MNQTESNRIVLVGSLSTIVVGNRLSLALDIIIDIRDEGRPHQLPVFLFSVQVDVHFVEQAGFVV